MTRSRSGSSSRQGNFRQRVGLRDGSEPVACITSHRGLASAKGRRERRLFPIGTPAFPSSACFPPAGLHPMSPVHTRACAVENDEEGNNKRATVSLERYLLWETVPRSWERCEAVGAYLRCNRPDTSWQTINVNPNSNSRLRRPSGHFPASRHIRLPARTMIRWDVWHLGHRGKAGTTLIVPHMARSVTYDKHKVRCKQVAPIIELSLEGDWDRDARQCRREHSTGG